MIKVQLTARLSDVLLFGLQKYLVNNLALWQQDKRVGSIINKACWHKSLEMRPKNALNKILHAKHFQKF